jgi:hypothetical protein
MTHGNITHKRCRYSPDIIRISCGEAYLDLQVSGYVSGVSVPEQLRRRGIATALWRYAEATEGIPMPLHSQTRTEDGDAWARAIGGPLPKLMLMGGHR